MLVLNSFKSTQIGQNKVLVVPVEFLQANSGDLDRCARILKSSALMPFETSEVTDFDNIVIVMGNDNQTENPPTLFIVRNLRQEGGKTPVIHVWKSLESFPGRSAMIKGGLTNREI